MTVLFEPDEPLAGERTDLAWTRTGIAVALCLIARAIGGAMRRRAPKVWPIYAKSC